MKTIACVLIIAAGFILSCILVSDEKEKILGLRCALDFISFMKSQIENFKTPIGEITEKYLRNAGGMSEYFDAEKTEDIAGYLESLAPDEGRTLWAVKEIMNSGYDDAVRLCGMLESRAGELLSGVEKESKEKKKAQLVLPTAGCLLLLILIM